MCVDVVVDVAYAVAGCSTLVLVPAVPQAPRDQSGRISIQLPHE